MAARIAIVEGGRVYQTTSVERLWFFPDGSEFLRYSAHFHMIHDTGFRSNFPLTAGFVVVMEGRMSIKDFYGVTVSKVDVRKHVWYRRGTHYTAETLYALMMLRVQHGFEPLRSACG